MRCAAAFLSLSALFLFPRSLSAGESRERSGARDGILGRWATAGFGSIVELHRCDADGTLCGRILWLWDALDSEGRPRSDRENPEGRARALPLVGAEVLRGFRETAPGVWTDGSVYNPDDGRTYSGTLTLQRNGALELEGCALRILCQRQVWRRPADLLEQAAER
jgi:uncharacterized protein (DUF2147 family)